MHSGVLPSGTGLAGDGTEREQGSCIRNMKQFDRVAKPARPVKVLLVEDDRAVRESLAQVLSSENYTVLQAEDTRQALCHYEQDAVDLAILDINLGGEDGWVLFESLHERSKATKPLPVIVMSAQNELLEHRLAFIARACWHKPLDISVVLSSLQTCLSPQATNP